MPPTLPRSNTHPPTRRTTPSGATAIGRPIAIAFGVFATASIGSFANAQDVAQASVANSASANSASANSASANNANANNASAPVATTDIDDQDGDGVLDAADRCPTNPEAYNGFEDSDGCPDTRGAGDLPPDLSAMIPLVGPNRLLVRNASTILRSVYALLRDHPRINEVTIEAHTDARGAEAFNLHLSQARADWVRTELIRLGVDPSRVVARGFGEYCPVDRSFGPAAWQRNRRVVFRVTRSHDPRAPAVVAGCPEATRAMGSTP